MSRFDISQLEAEGAETLMDVGEEIKDLEESTCDLTNKNYIHQQLASC